MSSIPLNFPKLLSIEEIEKHLFSKGYKFAPNEIYRWKLDGQEISKPVSKYKIKKI